jgi:hypothetical protein
MKNFLIMDFLLMAIVLISLCTDMPNFPNIPFLNEPLQPGTSGIEISNEDIYINVNALPSEVSGGSNVTLIFQITNRANYDLEDVSLNLYDPCVFNDGNSKETYIGKLKSNRTNTTSWNLNSSAITLSRDCELKFAVSYKGKFNFYQDVVVLTQSEYNIRLSQGTLHNIPIKSSYSSSPLQISLTFSEEQPLLENTNVDGQISYAYTGNGFIDVGKGDVKINLPSNLEVSGAGCRGDYNSGLSLVEPLKFINKKASPSTCTFKAKTSQLIDIKLLTITADYKYTIDSSVPIRVKGTSTTNPQPV